jgi:hypothetical protein
MRTISQREKVFIQVGVAGILLYVLYILFSGGAKKSSGGGGDYGQLLQRAEQLKRELKPYEQRAVDVKSLMEKFQMDPAKLSKASVVGQASAAIQNAAKSGGMQLGPIRESPGRASAKELATIKLDGTGQLPMALAFLKRLETLGYPLLIDSVQINADSKGPGMIKLSLTIIVLDFEQWKPEDAPHA